MTEANTDRERLQHDAYADSGRLRQRYGLHTFARRGVDFPEWALDHVELRPGRRILDVGCGHGAYLQRLVDRGYSEGVGADLSFGMATEAREHGPTIVVDAQSLPIADRAVDLVLAMHMLYHVPDVAAGLREFARVVVDGGTVAVALNGERHLGELRALLDAALVRVDHSRSLGPRSHERVNLTNLDQFVADELTEVARFIHEDEIVIEYADPVVDYLDSIRSLYSDALVGVAWDRVLEEARALVDATIVANGSWTTHQHAGVVILRRAVADDEPRPVSRSERRQRSDPRGSEPRQTSGRSASGRAISTRGRRRSRLRGPRYGHPALG